MKKMLSAFGLALVRQSTIKDLEDEVQRQAAALLAAAPSPSPPPKPIVRAPTLAHDLKTLIPSLKMRMIFDVGANVGQTVATLRRAYPDATIHAFEPVAASFAALQGNVAGQANTIVHQLAVSSHDHTVTMTAASTSTGNQIVPADATRMPPQVETVKAMAGDSFCSAQGIDRISFLKVDTEGHDLECLKGFNSKLLAGEIDVLQVEASMNRDNPRHVPMADFMTFLEPMGYRLFRIYDQTSEKAAPTLRRSNLVFIAPRLANASVESSSHRKSSKPVPMVSSTKRRGIVILSAGERPWLPGVAATFEAYAMQVGATLHVQRELPSESEFPFPQLPDRPGRPNKRIYACKTYFAWKYLAEYGYDQLLFVDDTCSVRAGAPDIFGATPSGALGYVKTGTAHAGISFAAIRQMIEDAKLPAIPYDHDHYMNSGVLIYSNAHTSMLSPDKIIAAHQLLMSILPHQTLTYYLMKAGGSEFAGLDSRFNVVPGTRLERSVRWQLTDILPYVNDDAFIQHLTGVYRKRELLVPQVTARHLNGWREVPAQKNPPVSRRFRSHQL